MARNSYWRNLHEISRFRRPLVLALLICVGLALVGCKPNPEGKYTASGGAVTLELKGGKATLGSMLGSSEPYDYTVDGDKVTLTNKAAPGTSVVLTIGKDGSLSGPMGVLTKVDK
jgi:hypothetical protein